MNYAVLLIDDEEDICYSIKRLLERDKEIEVDCSYSAEDGIEKFKNKKYDIVITDLILGEKNGIDVINELKVIDKEAVIVLITGKGSEDIAEMALKVGAYDYFSKPFKNNEFFKAIRNAKEKLELSNIKHKYEKITSDGSRFHKFLFRNEKMRELIEMVKKISKYDSLILITGESGTGKGVLAESIHLESSRSDKNFIKVNCGAIPDTLIESELFGYEKGAFTGAGNSKKGKIELAEHGTIFLDEIGEIDIKYQAKLLRVIEEKVIEKIGSENLKKVDVRIVAATNIELEEAVKEKKFREDLFHRLNIFNIVIPPLRERKEDIIYLADYFVKELCGKFSLNPKEISEELKKQLLMYNWPGNTRELMNCIENMIILSGDSSELKAADFFKIKKLGESSTSQNIEEESEQTEELYLKEYLKKKEREYLRIFIEKYKSKTEIARRLGISRQNLYDKIIEYKLE